MYDVWHTIASFMEPFETFVTLHGVERDARSVCVRKIMQDNAFWDYVKAMNLVLIGRAPIVRYWIRYRIRHSVPTLCDCSISVVSPKSSQCVGVTKKGERCKNFTRKGRCHLHLQ